eukprot:1147907-Pelagomonas_calceolata.AAC.5
MLPEFDGIEGAAFMFRSTQCCTQGVTQLQNVIQLQDVVNAAGWFTAAGRLTAAGMSLLEDVTQDAGCRGCHTAAKCHILCSRIRLSPLTFTMHAMPLLTVEHTLPCPLQICERETLLLPPNVCNGTLPLTITSVEGLVTHPSQVQHLMSSTYIPAHTYQHIHTSTVDYSLRPCYFAAQLCALQHPHPRSARLHLFAAVSSMAPLAFSASWGYGGFFVSAVSYRLTEEKENKSWEKVIGFNALTAKLYREWFPRAFAEAPCHRKHGQESSKQKRACRMLECCAVQRIHIATCCVQCVY